MGTYVSFHHDLDVARARQVQQVSAFVGQPLLDGQEWAAISGRGEGVARRWIDEHMRFSGAVVVLVGERTDQCPWVRREILTAWEDCRPLLGIHVHGLLDEAGRAGAKGQSPFHGLKFRSGGWMSDYVPVFEPEGDDAAAVLESIAEQLQGWIARGGRRMGPRPPRNSAITASLRG